MPSGRYTILVPQPGLNGWYKQEGGSAGFVSIGEATKHARTSGFEAKYAPELDADAIKRPKSKSKPKSRRMERWVVTPQRQKIMEAAHAIADDRGEFTVAVKALADLTGIKDPSVVSYQLRSLCAMGLLEKFPSDHIRQRGRYRLVDNKKSGTTQATPQRHKLKL